MSERILIAFYGEKGTGEIQRLVMACEAAYNNLGKRSFFGRDKGAEAKDKMNMALVRVIIALAEVGKTDKNNAKQSFTEVNKAMEWARRAWPNWPKAYKFWDEFYADICAPEPGNAASTSSKKPPIQEGIPARGDTSTKSFTGGSQNVERPTTDAVSPHENHLPHSERALVEISVRCKFCGIERNISPGAEGFHCTGCKQYNQVEGAVGSMGHGTASEKSRTPTDLREATVCAVIGCNAPIPAGKIVCPKHG